jgi:hypothetical protein
MYIFMFMYFHFSYKIIFLGFNNLYGHKDKMFF